MLHEEGAEPLSALLAMPPTTAPRSPACTQSRAGWNHPSQRSDPGARASPGDSGERRGPAIPQAEQGRAEGDVGGAHGAPRGTRTEAQPGACSERLLKLL